MDKLKLRLDAFPDIKDGPKCLSFARELRTVLCLGKNKFKNARTIGKSARYINKWGTLQVSVEGYECPFCKHWHLMPITEKGVRNE